MDIPLAERLIVAADFECDPKVGRGRKWMRSRVLDLAHNLKGTGVYLKVNSALRACGYELIDAVHDLGLKVFADLKLNDISETLTADGKLLFEAKPSLLTVMCTTGEVAMRALKAQLPDTEILGVTVLTSLEEAEVQTMFTCSGTEAVFRLAGIGAKGAVDGFISAATQAGMLRSGFAIARSINSPAIRPDWAIVKRDDQSLANTMTPAKAIAAGADRIVVGRPITQADDPVEATRRTLEEIRTALATAA